MPELQRAKSVSFLDRVHSVDKSSPHFCSTWTILAMQLCRCGALYATAILAHHNLPVYRLCHCGIATHLSRAFCFSIKSFELRPPAIP